MNVTINTDASHIRYKKMNFAGFAFWIVCNGVRIKRHGPLKNSPKDANIAECKCLGNAFHVVLNKYTGIKLLVINTDSDTCIKRLAKSSKNLKGDYSDCFYQTKIILEKIVKNNPGIKVRFRSIKSHQHKESKRNWVNDWCDKKARFEARKLVKAHGRRF